MRADWDEPRSTGDVQVQGAVPDADLWLHRLAPQQSRDFLCQVCSFLYTMCLSFGVGQVEHFAELPMGASLTVTRIFMRFKIGKRTSAQRIRYP